MNIVIVGHVDHGKSTVIGRLLADTHSLPQGKLEQIKELCRRTSKPFEYAFLLDALKDERAQGITIDTARCFFKTEKRKYIIIDAPGHIEFLKNMISGASRAQAALLVIDANEGIKENSRRHGYMLSMLGIKQVSVLVNKLDLISEESRESVYNSIVGEYGEFLEKIGMKPSSYIPVSAVEGWNIVENSESVPWYNGATVLETLDSFNELPAADGLPVRMWVQDVYHNSYAMFHGISMLPKCVVCGSKRKNGLRLVLWLQERGEGRRRNPPSLPGEGLAFSSANRLAVAWWNSDGCQKWLRYRSA